VLFDPGNMAKEGYEDWRMGIQIIQKYLAHVHVKNCVWKKTGHRPDGSAIWERFWETPMEGMADWPTIVAELKAVGYNGWLSLEDFAPMGTEEKLATNKRFLEELVARA
jgi:sugar phosphate isomerase/epimerase